MTSLRRTIRVSIGVGILATFILLFGRSAWAQEKLVVQVDWAPHGMHAGLHLAAQKGWFKAAGLDVEILDGKGSNTTIQQVAAGQIDIGFAQLATMAIAASNGLPVTSIMGLVRAGDNGLMVPVEAGYKSIADLKGKRIAVPAGSATSSFMDAFLRAGSVSPADVKLISIDPSAMVSLYTSGGADAAFSTVAYFAPIIADKRPSSGILMKDVGLNVPGYGLLARRDLIEKRADAVKAFVHVNQQVWRYIFAGHEEEAVDAILARRADLRLNRKVLLGQLKAYMTLFDTPATKGHPLGWQAESDWEKALTVMADANLVKPNLKPAEFYTNEFIEKN